MFNPLGPHDALKHHFTSLKTQLIFLRLRGFRRKITMKLFYQCMTIFFTFSPTSRHLHLPLQVENCGSNSRLVVDVVDDNGKFRLERFNQHVFSRLYLVIFWIQLNVIYLITLKKNPDGNCGSNPHLTVKKKYNEISQLKILNSF